MFKRFRIIQSDGSSQVHEADFLDIRDGCVVLFRIPPRNDRGDDDAVIFKAFAPGTWVFAEQLQ